MLQQVSKGLGKLGQQRLVVQISLDLGKPEDELLTGHMA
jgi:hypothetical protein